MSPKARPPVGGRILRAVAALLVAGAIAAGGWWGYEAIASRAVTRVVFAGDAGKLARADLDALAQSVRTASATGVSLAAVREAARRVPWVRDASVRRRFPDTVEIAFEAHEALARWSEHAIVSARGEVFIAETDADLPRFRGPEGAAATMAREFPPLARALAPLGGAMAELRLSPRGAWQVVLDSGLTLELGRSDTTARLARFVAAWPQLAEAGGEARHADLRYANGFAVRSSR